MWGYHHRDLFADLDALEIPPIVGRRLDVGGFVSTDHFDIFLRKLLVPYLAETWSHLQVYLERYNPIQVIFLGVVRILGKQGYPI
jgi:hypothetical protein